MRKAEAALETQRKGQAGKDRYGGGYGKERGVKIKTAQSEAGPVVEASTPPATSPEATTNAGDVSASVSG